MLCLFFLLCSSFPTTPTEIENKKFSGLSLFRSEEKTKSVSLLHFLFLNVAFVSTPLISCHRMWILINKFSRVIDTNTVHGELVVSMRHDTMRMAKNTKYTQRMMSRVKKTNIYIYKRFSRTIICLLCQRCENK